MRDGEPDVIEEDAIPFAAMTPVIVTHRFFGRSIADLVMDIQRIKTALLRALLDNVYISVAVIGANYCSFERAFKLLRILLLSQSCAGQGRVHRSSIRLVSDAFSIRLNHPASDCERLATVRR